MNTGQIVDELEAFGFGCVQYDQTDNWRETNFPVQIYTPTMHVFCGAFSVLDTDGRVGWQDASYIYVQSIRCTDKIFDSGEDFILKLAEHFS